MFDLTLQLIRHCSVSILGLHYPAITGFSVNKQSHTNSPRGHKLWIIHSKVALTSSTVHDT